MPPGAACIRDAFRRYTAREVGGGRATRQPGQVRKEAALASSGSGRLSASHSSFRRFVTTRAAEYAHPMTDCSADLALAPDVPAAGYRVLARKYRPATFDD